ncbi:hypothetical protein COCHEDRAFT_1226349 [Bipolaris maydis C5]|uniref:Centromere protein H C-terminal domain-containing protein n=1 Tax=Cochliobolus heterostrophus (strain C5 / ATCC 48332 / race O) TaxID=701091 RepID=M2TRP5_COCH5|nr:hypothetical protein COCHEDRAFT_1226349 [Bipolaris maydis C5]KAH7552556.1 hypothetical protein BM1_08507 [Bipolaris maydis]KAJ6212555.1 centromere protein H (CENP-H)-domain-containing protein [Bipolaris maydis]
MTTRGDVDMADVGAKRQDAHDDADLLQTTHSDAFAFSDTEMLALQLYDQLKELELQQSLLQAQQAGTLNMSNRREAMEAKTEYEIRNRITHNVLVMDPVRKAVHGGERTRFAEKRLLPLVTENDTVAMTHGAQTGRLASTTRALSAAEQGNMVANQKNRELAQTMLALAEEMKAQSVQDIEDAQLRSQVDAAEKQLAESRRRVKTLKGVLSGMIVGSGINWAADEGLTELVMDDEEDG